ARVREVASARSSPREAKRGRITERQYTGCGPPVNTRCPPSRLPATVGSSDLGGGSNSYFFLSALWQAGTCSWGGRFPSGAGTPLSRPAWSRRAWSSSAASHHMRRGLCRLVGGVLRLSVVLPHG